MKLSAPKTIANTSFSCGIASLRDFKTLGEPGVINVKADRRPTRMIVDGVEATATPRFWNSLLSRYALSDTVFNYFSPAEVFGRINKTKATNEKLQYTIQYDEDGKAQLLAVVSPTADIIKVPDLSALFSRHGSEGLSYHGGVVSARFKPDSNDLQRTIGSDDFQSRFVMEVPIDGYGRPSTYLEMLRLLCANGAVGRAPAFRSSINLGKKPMETLDRTLSTFDSEDGFAALRDRFAVAQMSPISVREAQLFRNLMMRSGPIGRTVVLTGRYDSIVGDFTRMYGLTNTELLTQKRQALLQGKCRVYDLLNLSSELSSHHAGVKEARAYQSFLGQLLSQDFDLEGTETKAPKFPAFVIPNRETVNSECLEKFGTIEAV